jgi:muconate cycloisomerase
MSEQTTVAAIEAIMFSAPLAVPVRYGRIERTKSASVLVRLRSSDGRVGYGESCAVPQLTGESAESIVALVDIYLRNLVVGTEVLNWRRTMSEIRHRFPKSFVGLCAVETAFLDLAGKQLGVPVHVLLGGRYRDRIELCASVSWDRDGRAMAEDAVRKAAEFKTLKVYVGPDDLATDLARLEAVRGAVDDGIRIMLDVKGLWTAHDAISVGPTLHELGVFLVEQPLPAEDERGVALVTRAYRDRFGILTAADESVETPAQVARIADAQSFGSVNIGVTKCGGPDIAIQAVHVAEAACLPVLAGSFAELGIATAAGIHFAAAIPKLAAPGYLSGPERFTQTITFPKLLPADGHAVVPRGPGLGVEVDEDLIASMASA